MRQEKRCTDKIALIGEIGKQIFADVFPKLYSAEGNVIVNGLLV